LTLLIPCYHQNSKGNVKHILFQHKGLLMLKHTWKILLVLKGNPKRLLLFNHKWKKLLVLTIC